MSSPVNSSFFAESNFARALGYDSTRTWCQWLVDFIPGQGGYSNWMSAVFKVFNGEGWEKAEVAPREYTSMNKETEEAASNSMNKETTETRPVKSSKTEQPKKSQRVEKVNIALKDSPLIGSAPEVIDIHEQIGPEQEAKDYEKRLVFERHEGGGGGVFLFQEDYDTIKEQLIREGLLPRS